MPFNEKEPIQQKGKQPDISQRHNSSKGWRDRLRLGSSSRDRGEPSPPTYPTRPEEKFVKEEVKDVRVSERQEGIPLSSWDAVSKALKRYESDSGIMPRTGDFSSRIIEYAKPGVDSGRGWSHTYYDSSINITGVDERGEWERRVYVGCFRRLRIEINKAALDGESAGYMLSLGANDFMGNREQEIALAEKLGIERAISEKEVTVELAKKGDKLDKFILDMDTPASLLSPIFKHKDKKGDDSTLGTEMANHFMSIYKHGWNSRYPFILGVVDGFRVSLQLRGMKRHRDHDFFGNDTKELWHRDNNILSRKLYRKSYPHQDTRESPSLVFSIVDSRRTNFPVISPERKAKMRALTEKLADAFRPKTDSLHPYNSPNLTESATTLV